MKRRKRCTLCRCTATTEIYGFPVCRYHYRHGEEDPPCPICTIIGNPRWTYTVNGELPPKKVEVRQSTIPKTVFLDNSREMVLHVQTVKEPAPLEWPTEKRYSVVIIGLGQQVGEDYVITQWASDWERELIDAARPRLALASKIYIEGATDFETDVLAGQWVSRNQQWGEPTLWPAIDIRQKTVNVYRTIREQRIGEQIDRVNDIKMKYAARLWAKKDREPVLRHNYYNLLDTSMKIFQIEWPA